MATSNETDLVKTTKWSLRCLEHKKTGFSLELKNIQTSRSHKMIFSCHGTNTISQPSYWTLGFYPMEFKTKFPVNFENFNSNLASIKPAEGHSKFHMLKIGWLATTRIHQPYGEGFGSWDLYGNCRIEYGNGEVVAPPVSTIPNGDGIPSEEVSFNYANGAVWSGVYDR